MLNMSEKKQDDETVYAGDTSPNSEESSSLAKRYLEGGPYGDGPGKYLQMFRDDVMLVMKGDRESSESTEEEKEDKAEEDELYSLKNEYLQKLKILRRKLETVHPFTLRSSETPPPVAVHETPTERLNLEYIPPKKKSCIRAKTPKLVSESNIPYRTQISLHENLFKPRKENEDEKETEKKLSREYMKKFTVTREAQCCEEEFDSAIGSSVKTKVNPKDFSLNINLFPKVVINYDNSSQMRSSSCTSSNADSSKLKSDKIHINLPNCVDDYSDEFCTPVTSTTIIDSGKKNKPKIDSEKLKHQYITYRKEKDRAKSTPIKIRSMVPFGPVILQDSEKIQTVDSRFYLFDSTSVSNDEIYAPDFTERAEPSVGHPNENPNFCNRFCGQFKRLIHFFRKN